MANTVYTSSFSANKTVGLDASSGKPTWEWDTAGYEPMVSDGRYAFLTGYQTIWAFGECAPRGRPNPQRLPRCGVVRDLHLVDVKRALRLDKPQPSAVRTSAGG
jgi:hypothetical protein